MAPLVECLGVRYAYRPGPQEVVALDGVDLTVGRGEFVSVVGANGSGKSTLARHLNGLLLPTEGEVRVAGMSTRDPARLWEIRRTVGMVFQNPDNQLVATTVEEDVAFGPENLGLPPEEIAARVDAALQAVGMAEHRLRAPHHLSGGQKQRVAIAGVLAMQPDCLVLDEPTTMLDPAGRGEVLATLLRLHRERGLAVVLITHFMDEAALADRVVVMARGRVAADGPPAAVLEDVELLAAAGLKPPPAALLARRLRARGVELPPGIVRPEALVEALCRWPSRG